MLSKEKFQPLFHESWHSKLDGFLVVLEPIYAELKELSNRGKEIFPIWQDVFKTFEYTKLDEMKAVVCGIGPYHTLYKGKQIIADGVALSCSKTGQEQPSLTKFWDAMEKEYKGQSITRSTDLRYLCERGVLMFNMSLTVENRKPLSHNDLWLPFVRCVFENVIAPSGVPVILLGKESHLAEKWCAPFQWCFKVSHPASASYSDTTWDSEGVFKKVERIVKDNTKENLKWSI